MNYADIIAELLTDDPDVINDVISEVRGPAPIGREALAGVYKALRGMGWKVDFRGHTRGGDLENLTLKKELTDKDRATVGRLADSNAFVFVNAMPRENTLLLNVAYHIPVMTRGRINYLTDHDVLSPQKDRHITEPITFESLPEVLNRIVWPRYISKIKREAQRRKR